MCAGLYILVIYIFMSEIVNINFAPSKVPIHRILAFQNPPRFRSNFMDIFVQGILRRICWFCFGVLYKGERFIVIQKQDQTYIYYYYFSGFSSPFPFSQSLLFFLSLSRRHPSFFFYLFPFFPCPILFFSLSFLFSTLLPLVSSLFHSLLHLISILSFFPLALSYTFSSCFLLLLFTLPSFFLFFPSFFLSYPSHTFLPFLFSPIFSPFSISSDEYIRIQYTNSIIRYSRRRQTVQCV